MINRGRMKNKIYVLPNGAYIFDNDGVLVDTEPKWFEAYARLLKPYGVIYEMPIHRQIMGQSAENCIKFIQKTHPQLPQGAAGTEELLKKRALLIQAVKTESPIRPKPGVIEFLDEVKKRNFPIAMATGTPRDEINAQLASLGWEKMFDAVVAGDERAQLSRLIPHHGARRTASHAMRSAGCSRARVREVRSWISRTFASESISTARNWTSWSFSALTI